MNINFLKFNEHTQTEEFLDMLYANNILPIITKPTRLTDLTATLIDHIYTNCLQIFTPHRRRARRNGCFRRLQES